MTTCPNCGKEIASADKFCSNCGAPLSGQPSRAAEPGGSNEIEETFEVTQNSATGTTEITESVSETVESPSPSTGWTPPPPVTPNFSSSDARNTGPMPPAVDFKPTSRPSVEEEWRMSSLGPPPKRKRSIWLYLLIGILALCLLSCVGFIGFSMTDTGQNWIENMATEAARQATEVAD